MRRFLLAVVLAILLVAKPTIGGIPPTVHLMANESGQCTVSPVDSMGYHGYLAVTHCIVNHVGVAAVDIKIDGVEAKVLKIDSELAFLTGGPDSLSFHVANKLPKVGEEVYMIGKPYAGPDVFVRGVFSAPAITFDSGRVLALFQLPIAIGNSGSPIFNNSGKIVGIATSEPCDTEGFCPMTLAVTLGELNSFLQR